MQMHAARCSQIRMQHQQCEHGLAMPSWSAFSQRRWQNSVAFERRCREMFVLRMDTDPTEAKPCCCKHFDLGEAVL
jgi:Na+-transporting NADH:ubiquinone oxidoreductase subunit NqrA